MAYIKFQELEKNTRKILSDNMDLLKQMGLRIGEYGKMMGPEFEEMIKNNTSGTLNQGRLEIAKKENSWDWYEEKLKG